MEKGETEGEVGTDVWCKHEQESDKEKLEGGGREREDCLGHRKRTEC